MCDCGAMDCRSCGPAQGYDYPYREVADRFTPAPRYFRPTPETPEQEEARTARWMRFMERVRLHDDMRQLARLSDGEAL